MLCKETAPLELFLGKSLRHDAAAKIDELASGLERNGLYVPHIGSNLSLACRPHVGKKHPLEPADELSLKLTVSEREVFFQRFDVVELLTKFFPFPAVLLKEGAYAFSSWRNVSYLGPEAG